MSLDKLEKRGLNDILKEVCDSKKTFKRMMKVGNSKGENKEFYRGQYESYSRQKVLLERYMRFHSIIK